MYKYHTRLNLIEGGNRFKQGDRITLAFAPLDYKGEAIDLTGKQINGMIYSTAKGVIYEKVAAYDAERKLILFSIDETVDYGTFQVEFTVTDSANSNYRLKIPSDPTDGRINILGSADNMDFVGVKMTTVAQLRNEQVQLQQEFASQVLPRVNTVEGKQTQLEADYQAAAGALTEDSEVILARKGEPTLRAFNDKVVAQLADTTASAGKPIDHSVWAEFTDRMYNAKWFGAVGDGVTNDQPALQAAVNYVHSIGGGTIYLPPGRYKVTSHVEWETKVSLVGAGAGISIIYPVGQGFAAIRQTNELKYNKDNPLTDVMFSNFEVDGTGFTSTEHAMNTKALFILYMKRSYFLNLYIHDTVGTGLGCDFLDQTLIHGVIAENCGRLWGIGDPGNMIGGAGIGIGTGIWENETLTISDCQAINCGGHGIFVEKQGNAPYAAKHIKIVNCHAIGGRANGISDKGVKNLQVIGCTMTDNAGYGFNVLGNVNATEGILSDCTITDNLVGVGIGQIPNARYILKGNRIARNKERGIQVSVAGSSVDGITIKDNEIHENGLQGIHLIGQSAGGIRNADINNNNIYNNGKNLAGGIGQAGVAIEVPLTGFKISYNRMYDTQGNKTQIRGIRTSSAYAYSDGLISGNDTRGLALGMELLGTVASSVKIRNNEGYLTENYGSATFADGATTVTVAHGLAKQPTSVQVTPRANAAVWIDTIGVNSVIYKRLNTTGTLAIDWQARS